jgi:hypothetical protein
LARAGITWEQLVELEPRLLELYKQAEQVIDDGSSPSFCANDIWYEQFKPRLEELVGSEAGIPYALYEAGPGPSDGEPHPIGEFVHWATERESGWQKIQRVVPEDLKTGDAYDLAYHRIYDRLPDCRNCSCL